MTPRPRAGILVTGTEVLTGIIQDRNGPWLSERLREMGVEVASITVVGDRPDDLLRELSAMRDAGFSLIVTSGGLGPTADDLTAEVVGKFQGREMVLDEALEERIAEILRPLADRWPDLDLEAVRAANRKQAVIPSGSAILSPVGTAPGLVVPPLAGAAPTVVVLPGPPRELHPMWQEAIATEGFRAAVEGAPQLERRILRLFGMPESQLAGSLREMEADGLDLTQLEVTTCLRRGEIEIATTFAADAIEPYAVFEAEIERRHGELLYSRDGSTIDEVVAKLLSGSSLAVGESCTGGMLASRICDRPGASAYFSGGVVAYSNSAKSGLLGVDSGLIEAEGAVSEPVALAMADGARSRFGSEVGVGITGIAGPGGGTETKPLGLVWFAVSTQTGSRSRSVTLPGGRADIRDRATTVAMHMIRLAIEQLRA